MWKCTSPSKALELAVWQADDLSLRYGVQLHGKNVLENSRAGLAVKGLRLENLQFAAREDASIRESYSLPVGKKAVYTNNAEEMALSFRAGENTLILRARVMDDAIAFRYEIPGETGTTLEILHEDSTFTFDAAFDTLFLQDWIKSYEGQYLPKAWGMELDAQPYGMPALLHAPSIGIWAMINEAQVLTRAGEYCSSHLRGTAGRTFELAFAPEEKGKPIPSPMPFYTPWRYVVIVESLDALLNSTVNYNLNPPSQMEDTSWIRPARALWAWWEYENAAQLYTESKAYIDYAAAMGFEAVTLDCPWDATCVKALCDYAHARGVQVHIWTGMQRIDTLEKAQALIPLWASWGVDGLKVDFFENDSSHTMWQYNMIAELMTEHKMMINFHGSTKPMGEGRTWPNFMTTEGIMGLEHYKWSDLPNAVHNCTVPFTRNVCGPMDYTPTGFSNPNRNTTHAHQMALPVVYESGITHYSLSLYFAEAWTGTDFLRRSLPKYDGLKVLSGYPGDHAAILRYKDDQYLIGVITTRSQLLPLALDFLPEGQFEAEIYEDQDKGERIAVRTQTVTRDDVLMLPLLPNGGAGVYIAPGLSPLPTGVQGGYMSAARTVHPGAEAKMLGGSEPVCWDWENKTKGVLLNGGARFVVDVPERKRYTLRLFYAVTEPVTLRVENGTYKDWTVLPRTGTVRTFATHDVTLNLEKGLNQLYIWRENGAIPGITALHVIDNDPPEVITLGAELGALTGGASLAKAADGTWEAVGLGGDAQLVYEDVCLPKDGMYVLRVDYTGGESRDLRIVANGDTVVETYLHSTAGWDFATWKNAEGKEVRIALRAGKNSICLCNPNGPMSHIRGIALLPDDIS